MGSLILLVDLNRRMAGIDFPVGENHSFWNSKTMGLRSMFEEGLNPICEQCLVDITANPLTVDYGSLRWDLNVWQL